MTQATRHFHAGYGPALRAWFAAHPTTRLRLHTVADGYIVSMLPRDAAIVAHTAPPLVLAAWMEVIR